MEASDFFVSGYFSNAGDEQNSNNNNNNFTVDDLLDFSKEDEVMTDAFFDSFTGNSADSSTVTVVDSCNSSVSGENGHFNGNISCRSFTDAPFPSSELCVPYDDLAELEWLSNFVEESFSSDDVQNLQLIPVTNINSAANNTTDSSSSATTISAGTNSPPAFPVDTSVPGKARSKRSRAAPCDWSSRLQLLLSPVTSSSESNDAAANNSTSATAKATKAPSKKRESIETPGRKCLHCASEKTPQWRTGPMGPKTLCNACGVRYKSGRLVPEYRPAASPTFVSAKHSNSHRKVLELRRQKEFQRHPAHHHQHQLISQTSIFGVSNGGDDFLLHHHQNCGPNFRHLI
ncbi:GATA transcription factor 12-like [Nicotiana tomentosiformis]|uniref:GATA transcription factor 12-like n=1 Tax=Nicotiana tomentosiformis TaxID=4098 RepID=UPI00051B8832|nr:GATA transcription factor 12-like [Nicotiana tomentosiformis]